MSDLTALVNNYLSNGGFFNPELMEHDKVRDMVIALRDEIERLVIDQAEYEEEIDRLNERIDRLEAALRRIKTEPGNARDCRRLAAEVLGDKDEG